MTKEAELKRQAYDSTLKSRALSVLLYLIDRSNKELTCFPAIPTKLLGEWSNMDGERLICLGFRFQLLDEAVEHSFGVAVYTGVLCEGSNEI